MRWTSVLLAASLLCGATSAPAQAQRGTRSPHGDAPTATACGDCHTSEAWRPLRERLAFDHARRTGFGLHGAHREVACVACHTDARFDQPRATEEECGACHGDPHEGTLSIDCAGCHEPTTFAAARAPEAHLRSAFPLTGAHAVIACERCHREGLAGPLATLESECVACHARNR